METRVLARKLKLTSFSGNWEIRLTFTTVDDKKFFFFGYNPYNVAKQHLGKKFSEHDIQHTQVTTEKGFFLVYHKLGWDIE